MVLTFENDQFLVTVLGPEKIDLESSWLRVVDYGTSILSVLRSTISASKRFQSLLYSRFHSTVNRKSFPRVFFWQKLLNSRNFRKSTVFMHIFRRNRLFKLCIKTEPHCIRGRELINTLNESGSLR